MPRPAVDKAMMRQRFIRAAEEILRSNAGTQLALADVAEWLGMSQSNSYRYFQNRQALITALAENWFAGVEQEVADAVSSVEAVEEKVRAWVLSTMHAKCARHDADPALFSAYLNLAKGEGEAIARHVACLRDIVRPAIVELAGRADSESAIALIEDATILYRNPFLIAQHRATLSVERALLVTEAVLAMIAGRQLGR